MTQSLVGAWCCVAHLFPGLHLDWFAEPNSGWLRVLRPFDPEVWRRVGAVEISEAELYPPEAEWAAINDLMLLGLADETERQVSLGVSFVLPVAEVGGQALQWKLRLV